MTCARESGAILFYSHAFLPTPCQILLPGRTASPIPVWDTAGSPPLQTPLALRRPAWETTGSRSLLPLGSGNTQRATDSGNTIYHFFFIIKDLLARGAAHAGSGTRGVPAAPPRSAPARPPWIRGNAPGAEPPQHSSACRENFHNALGGGNALRRDARKRSFNKKQSLAQLEQRVFFLGIPWPPTSCHASQGA